MHHLLQLHAFRWSRCLISILKDLFFICFDHHLAAFLHILKEINLQHIAQKLSTHSHEKYIYTLNIRQKITYIRVRAEGRIELLCFYTPTDLKSAHHTSEDHPRINIVITARRNRTNISCFVNWSSNFNKQAL